MKKITATELKSILDSHKLWLETNGKKGVCATLTGADLFGANLTDANLRGAYLRYANLYNANLTGADLWDANLAGADLTDANLNCTNLWGANLQGATLTGAILNDANLWGANLNRTNLTGANGLPDISWIIPGCLIQLNSIGCGFCLKNHKKWDNFVQDSFGFFIQDNMEENTFDLLVGDRIIRGIPDWVKYSGMKKIV